MTCGATSDAGNGISRAIEMEGLRTPYCRALPTDEKTLFAPDPIMRMVPTTTARITASITAYSATSCPSSPDNLCQSCIIVDPHANQTCLGYWPPRRRRNHTVECAKVCISNLLPPVNYFDSLRPKDLLTPGQNYGFRIGIELSP